MNESKSADTQTSAKEFELNINKFFDRLSSDVQTAVSNKQPDLALAHIMNFITAANIFAQTQHGIINKLNSMIGNLLKLLESVAKNYNATSYSISASLPIGISISLSWDVKPRKVKMAHDYE